MVATWRFWQALTRLDTPPLSIRGHPDSPVALVDGGIVDWGAARLSNAKERMPVSGTGSDRIVAMRRSSRHRPLTFP